MQHALIIDAQCKHGAIKGQVDDGAAQRGRGQHPVRRQAGRQHWRRRLFLDLHEQQREQQRSEHGSNSCRAPALAAVLGQGIRQRRQAGSRAELPWHVDAPVDARRWRRAAHDEHDGSHADRYIQEKHAAPAQMFDHQTTKNRPGRERQATARTPGGDGRGARDRIVECDADHRQRGGQQHGRAHALQTAHRDQHLQAGSHAATDRRHRKREEAGDEHGARAELVAKRAPQYQQGREDQCVAVDDPLQAGQVGIESSLEITQGHVDHADIKLHYQKSQAGGSLDGDQGGGSIGTHGRGTEKGRDQCIVGPNRRKCPNPRTHPAYLHTS